MILLLAAGLTACASQQRSGPPAPVDTAGVRTAPEMAQASKPAPVKPEESTVEVYAYRPPASDPGAFAPGTGLAMESATPPSMTSLPTESAAPSAVPPAPSGSASVSSVPAPSPTPQVVAYAPPAPPLPPAAESLAKQAEQQRQARDYVGAAATLERALRIDPQEAYLWNRLARVRLEQGSYAQAGNMAARSNALSKDQAALKQSNWGIIAASRRAAGDTAGAMEAEQKARGG